MPSTSAPKTGPTKIHGPALRPYLEQGFTLIPLHKPDATRTENGVARKIGKAPVHRNWTHRKYNSRNVARQCVHDGCNIGVRLTDEHVVIDVDPRNGGDEGFFNLCLDIGLDDRAFPHVITGSGGSHFYMVKPPKVRVLDTHKKYPGVEFKSLGRQVVAAGSIHPDTGKHYRWDDTRPPVTEMPEAPCALLEAIARPKCVVTAIGGEYTPEQVATMLGGLDPADYANNDAWLKIMMASHHASNGDARSEFIEWSIRDPQYADDADGIGRRWDSLHAERNDGVSYKSLHHELREHRAGHLIPASDASADFEAVADNDDEDVSWLEGGSGNLPMAVEHRGLKLVRGVAPDTFENALCAVTKAALNPAWNELKQCVEFRAVDLPWPEHYGRVLTDHVLRLARHYLLRQFQGVAYSPGKDHLLEAVMTLAYQNKFNPILDYLAGLKWDGTLRLERLFSDYFKCGDDSYTRAVATCFMIGAVRRQQHPGCKFDTVPIIHGKQGWGKSTGIRALFSSPWFSDAEMGNLADKDAPMKLRGIWVQELAEIDSLTRAATSTMKAFVSRSCDRQRDPYDRLVQDVPRRCVFIGSTNEGGFLKDATGARRFWPLELREPVDVAAIERDRDQLWAEAATLEAKGASDVLSKELWPVAAERQARQTSDDPWADTLATFLAQRHVPQFEGDIPLPPNRVHTSELFDALSISPSDQSKDKAQRLRTVMEQCLGWQYPGTVRVLGKPARGYKREA
jgi:hypothetical protein